MENVKDSIYLGGASESVMVDLQQRLESKGASLDLVQLAKVGGPLDSQVSGQHILQMRPDMCLGVGQEWLGIKKFEYTAKGQNL